METEFKPISKLRACILDRKYTTGMTWEDIGRQAGVSPNTLQYLMRTQDPWLWNVEIQEAVCKVLGIQIKKILVGWDNY